MANVTLSQDQHRHLRRLVAARAGILTALQREALLEDAGLASFKTQLNFDTDPNNFASQLVRVLQEHGTLAEMGQPALVSLLRELRDRVAGHEDDAAFLDTLLTPYSSSVNAPQPTSVANARHVGGGEETERARVGPVRKRWALLVGVNRYVDPAIPPLQYCVNDVRALEEQLTTLGYTVVTLHDEMAEEHLQPTRENVEAELERLCRVAAADDLLLVHFSGHGKLVEGKPVLLTRESRLATAARRALPVAEVETRLRESAARRYVLLLDACHSGVAMAKDVLDPAFVENVYELAEGFALLAATSADEVALEWKEGRHGVFTYYLLEGLRGKADRGSKGFVSFHDLESHVLDALREWSIRRGGLVQIPTRRAEGYGDMILADYRTG